jgi:hypothetical protein
LSQEPGKVLPFNILGKCFQFLLPGIRVPFEAGAIPGAYQLFRGISETAFDVYLACPGFFMILNPPA